MGTPIAQERPDSLGHTLSMVHEEMGEGGWMRIQGKSLLELDT